MSVALILGAGGRVGKAVALKLVQNDFKVAVGSRSGVDVTNGKAFPVKVDVSNPAEIFGAFKETEQNLGAPPNVVIYNVAAFSPAPTPGDPFSLPYEQYIKDLTAGGLGAYPTLQHSLTAFRKLHRATPKVFIATSNLFGVSPAPAAADFLSLAAQKRSLAFLIEASVKAYKKDVFRFYLPSQTTLDGKPPFKEFSAEAHGVVYWNLIQRAEQGEWDVRFVKDGTIIQRLH